MHETFFSLMYLGVSNGCLADVQIEVVRLVEPLCVVLSWHKVATKVRLAWSPRICQ